MSYNRVKTSTTSTGNGTLTVSASAAARHKPLSTIPNGTTGVPLLIEDEAGSDWELSYCTVLTATTFSRDTLIDSSTGAKVNFGAGPKSVSYTLTAGMFDRLAGGDNAAATTIGDVATWSIPAFDPSGAPKRITIANLLAAIGQGATQLPAAGTLTGTHILTVTNSDGTDAQTTLSALQTFLGGASVPSATSTALTLTGPTSGTAGTASGNFTVAANGTLSSTVVVTPSDGGAGGTFTPSTRSLTSAATSATFTYTASASGARTISISNNGSLSNPTGIVFTAASSSSTVSGVTVSPSTATLTTNTQAFTASVAGTNSPSQSVTWTASAGSINTGGLFTPPAQTGSAQTVTITATSVQDNTKAGTATVTVSAAVQTTYTGINFYDGATVKQTLAVGAFAVFDANHQIGSGNTVSTSGPYLNIKATPGGTSATAARFGWSTSPTVPPLDDPQFYASNNGPSIPRTNAYVNITSNGTAWYAGDVILWVPTGTPDNTKFYPWVKPADGNHFCLSTTGMAVTGA